MTPASRRNRLVLEVLVIVAIAELGVMLSWPAWSALLGRSLSSLWDALLMAILAAPAVWWRCREALRDAAAAQEMKQERAPAAACHPARSPVTGTAPDALPEPERKSA